MDSYGNSNYRVRAAAAAATSATAAAAATAQQGFAVQHYVQVPADSCFGVWFLQVPFQAGIIKEV